MSDKDNERLKKTTIAFLKDFAEQGYENAVECIDWLEKQTDKGNQITLPTFTFDDVLALQRVMETVVFEDETLFEQFQSLHDRLYDAYCLNK